MDFISHGFKDENVGVGKLALLIWLVKLMFNYNVNVNTRKHE